MDMAFFVAPAGIEQWYAAAVLGQFGGDLLVGTRKLSDVVCLAGRQRDPQVDVPRSWNAQSESWR